jgi:hypothetical protein
MYSTVRGRKGNNVRSTLITKIGYTNSVGDPDPVGPDFLAGSGLFIGSSIFNTRSDPASVPTLIIFTIIIIPLHIHSMK